MNPPLSPLPDKWKAVTQKRSNGYLGITRESAIHIFFGGNAFAAIVILSLIMIFLFREGAGFFALQQRGMEIKRLSGIELVDYLKNTQSDFTALSRLLTDVRVIELNHLTQQGLTFQAATAKLLDFDRFQSELNPLGDELQDLISEMTEEAASLKGKAEVLHERTEEKQMHLRKGDSQAAAQINITPIDYPKEIQKLTNRIPEFEKICHQLGTSLEAQIKKLPSVSKGATHKLLVFKKGSAFFIQSLPKTIASCKNWNQQKPVSFYESFTAFFLGKEWVTNSWWQDYYGLIPLLTGSLLISLLALAISVPLGVCSAIYLNQVASLREQQWIKPYIEFISAIPSVVLGFWGMAVLGDGLVWLSQQSFLAWIPFFPIQGGLNVFTAGCLLGLMAVPTIFSLSEDALNNVPNAFKEASFALGATRFQTICNIIVPGALSGIISAILLGFGRVIGETMVVLLVAGNRIAIPDFTEGLGVFFQPAHTLTGIIAQELGEVVQGSLHYRALFVVGLVLFFISLLVNYMAQKIVQRYRLSGF